MNILPQEEKLLIIMIKLLQIIQKSQLLTELLIAIMFFISILYYLEGDARQGRVESISC